MRKDDCFELGLITKPHGLKGEAVVFLDVDDPSEYYQMESVFVEQNNKLIPFFISDITPANNQKIIVRFDDINSLDELNELIGARLWLPLDVLPKLEKGFYYHDVLGYSVVDEYLGALGTVKTFLDSGPQALMIMDYRSCEVMIPVTDEIVKEASHDNNTIYVQLPEGLLELYIDPESEREDEN